MENNITNQPMAQTAIDWLLEQAYLISSTKWPDIVEEALEMEKEQITKAYEFGVGDAYNYTSEEGEQYYNETYGK